LSSRREIVIKRTATIGNIHWMDLITHILRMNFLILMLNLNLVIIFNIRNFKGINFSTLQYTHSICLCVETLPVSTEERVGSSWFFTQLVVNFKNHTPSVLFIHINYKKMRK
jgi:hypothetical protein